MRGAGLLLALALVACGADHAGPAAPASGRVLILGLDGTRSEGIELAQAPHLDALRAEGFTDLDAIAGDVSLSGPGWASMLSGVWCDRHKVVDNDVSWANSNFDAYPHFLARAEQARPALRTASVVHWAPINDEILCADERADDCGGVDAVITRDSDAGVRDAVVDLLRDGDPDAVFVQFDDIDHAGHGTAPSSPPGGFCPKPSGAVDGNCLLRGLNAEYLAEIERIDGYIGDILAALRARPRYALENWLILVSPDHGGGGLVFNQHGFDVAQDRRTFLIVAGPAARPLPGTPVTRLADLPPAENNGLPPADTRGAKLVDIAATALFHLGIPIDPDWQLAGQPLGVAGAPDYEERAIPSCYSAAPFTP
ncbi:alkaline phosphatase family protein [Fontimonas sp. SYSU GA230001]|uniref:alkaline phosphatase family protein n=1 Tax=Fontimonas sp. SYSU GA230001 TaxID=3142450 RepID=UPI0032B42F1D